MEDSDSQENAVCLVIKPIELDPVTGEPKTVCHYELGRPGSCISNPLWLSTVYQSMCWGGLYTQPLHNHPCGPGLTPPLHTQAGQAAVNLYQVEFTAGLGSVD